ncbi:MAG TPA: 6-bladed beta-propeller [Tepidisphaeraceae bacterium]|nr:6-bladed beta-propeller [Tepidisphaeraceae bacterium]
MIARWKILGLTAILMGIALLASCAHDAGVIFPTLPNAPQWPEVGPPRIRYVGALSSSADLKPAVSGIEAIGKTLFGSAPVHTIENPMAVCTDNAGRVFIADTQNHAVLVMNLNTRIFAQWRPVNEPFKTPVSLAYDAGGHRLLVSDSTAGAIQIFSDNGKYQGQFAPGQFHRSCGIAIDRRNGRVFVADVAAHQIVILTPTGQIIQRLSHRGNALGEFNFPTYVALDSQGRLYVSDSLNFRIQEFSPDLKPIRQIGTQGDSPGYFAEPKGIAIDNEDHLYVVDAQFEAVQIFNANGQLLLNLGEQGRKPGEFWLPAGISVDVRNRIWIADSANHRVQVFDYLTEGEE